jgi:hypothetical protein
VRKRSRLGFDRTKQFPTNLDMFHFMTAFDPRRLLQINIWLRETGQLGTLAVCLSIVG